MVDFLFLKFKSIILLFIMFATPNKRRSCKHQGESSPHNVLFKPTCKSEKL